MHCFYKNCAIVVRMEQKRGYRYRSYPTSEQANMLARTFGSVRFVYHWALHLRTDAFFQRRERLGYHDLSAALTARKRQPETAWLNEVSSVPLQQALRHLDKAFHNFCEGHTRYPSVRKKRGRQAATYATSAFKWDAQAHSLTLAKMDASLEIHWSRAFTALRQKAPPLRAGDEWPLVISTPGCYTARELSLSPWGIMAWGTTPRSPRLSAVGICH
jgi:transposase